MAWLRALAGVEAPYLTVEELNHFRKHGSAPPISGSHEEGPVAVVSGGDERLPSLFCGKGVY